MEEPTERDSSCLLKSNFQHLFIVNFLQQMLPPSDHFVHMTININFLIFGKNFLTLLNR